MALRPADREPLRSACCGSTRPSCSAGAAPNSRPQPMPSDDREGEAERIEAGLKPDRERAVRRHRRSASVPHHAIRMPTTAPKHAEQQVLGQHQPDHAARTGAEREPHADFAVARAGAREHEVGGVAADREQHQQHHALQDAERGDEHHLRTARRLPERHHLAADAAVGLGKRLPPARASPTRTPPWRRASVGAVAQAAHRGVAALVAILELARSGEQRRRQRRRHPEVELQREDRALEILRARRR